jgi:hypothetical protein
MSFSSHAAVQPPSMVTTEPVLKLASSDSR